MRAVDLLAPWKMPSYIPDIRMLYPPLWSNRILLGMSLLFPAAAIVLVIRSSFNPTHFTM